MERDFIIITDTTADLPKEYLKENQVGVLSLNYSIDGEEYTLDKELPYKEFYEKMRKGSMPTTSQANPETARELLQKYLEQGLDILYLSFSSGLSGSCNSVRLAKEELSEVYPEAKIEVVDSLAASMGEGLLVHKVIQLKKEGKTLEQTAKWAEENKLHIVHVFTVDDLFHLYRGGRVSKAAAVLGTIVNVKPVLHVDNEGHLIPISKVRGRKKALQALVDKMEEKIGDYRDKNDIVFISHGDALEDAEYVAGLVEQKYGIKNFLIAPIGPTIGAHSGPSTIALFFMGNER